MYNPYVVRRRDFLGTLAAVGIAAAQTETTQPKHKGRLKQCVMKVNFDPNMPFEDMCRTAVELGAYGMDLTRPNEWPTLAKYGLIPTMAGPGPVTMAGGLIHPELHEAMEKPMHEAIDAAAAAGCPNIITVGGQRKDMDREKGAENAAVFLNKVKSHAEDKGVTICMEIMNSKFTDQTLGRPDQICDHVDWGVDVCKRVSSPRVKLLFDIYHVQTMDGDVTRNIRNNYEWIAHFHTGGVPGRHELDETQELNYRFLAQAIADLGFTGYIAHEFRPAPGRDPIQSLRQAMDILTV